MNATDYPQSNTFRKRKARIGALAFLLAAALSVVVSAPSPSQAAAQDCPDFPSSTVVGELQRSSINEASGLVASRTHSNRLWLHNDSGGSNRIFAMTQTGDDRGTVVLGNRPASDWEDIAIGPGPDPNKDYLYVADVGNNGHRRATVRIYRIAEPTPPGAGKTITIPDSQIETFVYAYENPNNPGTHWRRNAEGVIVDPRSGDLIIFEKQVQTINGRSNMGWVYKIDKDELVEGRTITARPKTAVKQRIGDYSPLTGADISADGKLIIAKNGWETFAWLRGSNQTVFAALAAHPVSSCIAPRTPGEAIAILPNGNAYLSVTERVHAPVWRVAVDYDGAPPPPPPPPPPPGGYTCNGREATIIGTNGDDVLIGTDKVDVIMGLKGDDVIKGLKKGDHICGGPGRDVIYGNKGADHLLGNDGGDRIMGGGGDDFILGDKGSDKLFGDDGADYIAGAVGDDKLVGGAGNDQLLAGAGTDVCKGGAGDDDYQSCE